MVGTWGAALHLPIDKRLASRDQQQQIRCTSNRQAVRYKLHCFNKKDESFIKEFDENVYKNYAIWKQGIGASGNRLRWKKPTCLQRILHFYAELQVKLKDSISHAT